MLELEVLDLDAVEGRQPVADALAPGAGRVVDPGRIER